MEILGLAIVVVLLLLAATFVIRFLLVKKSPEYRKAFVNAELASGMINTMLKTTAKDCSKATMKDLLQDCSSLQSLMCDNGMDSCSYFNDAADSIFGATLDAWNYKYFFTAKSGQETPFIKKGSECPPGKKSKNYIVPNAIPIEVKLDICT
jgi:hypothetical protein